ncbi:MAG: hypothetical protein RRY95_08025, partial [Oscillospiraceae bacterium]
GSAGHGKEQSAGGGGGDHCPQTDVGREVALGNHLVFWIFWEKDLTNTDKGHIIVNTISFREKGSSFRLAATITRLM